MGPRDRLSPSMRMRANRANGTSTHYGVEHGATGHGALHVGCPEFAIPTTKQLP
jgi:hypothetical protein